MGFLLLLLDLWSTLVPFFLRVERNFLIQEPSLVLPMVKYTDVPHGHGYIFIEESIKPQNDIYIIIYKF